MYPFPNEIVMALNWDLRWKRKWRDLAQLMADSDGGEP